MHKKTKDKERIKHMKIVHGLKGVCNIKKMLVNNDACGH